MSNTFRYIPDSKAPSTRERIFINYNVQLVLTRFHSVRWKQNRTEIGTYIVNFCSVAPISVPLCQSIAEFQALPLSELIIKLMNSEDYLSKTGTHTAQAQVQFTRSLKRALQVSLQAEKKPKKSLRNCWPHAEQKQFLQIGKDATVSEELDNCVTSFDRTRDLRQGFRLNLSLFFK